MQSITLPNGLVVHLVENHRLPLVTTVMIVHGGAAHRQPGVARLVVTSIARGSQTLTPAAFAERLGALGGEVHADVSPDYTRLSIDALAEKWQETLQVVGDAVMHPTYARRTCKRWPPS